MRSDDRAADEARPPPCDCVARNAGRGRYTAADAAGPQIHVRLTRPKGQFATVPDLKPLAHYDAILANLEKLIPGEGSLAARVDAFNERYTIPKDRLQSVFDAAIAECKKRTAAHIRLPAGENFHDGVCHRQNLVGL